MGGGGFILAINLSLAALLAAVFLFIAAYDRAASAPRWMTLSYGLGFAYVGLEFLVSVLPQIQFLVVAAYMAFAFAIAAYNIGIARKYQQPAPGPVTAGLLFYALATIVLHGGEPEFAAVPMLLYQLPYAVLQAHSALIVARADEKRSLDYTLVALLAASALHFLAKPVIGLALGSIGANSGDYIDTTYALFSQTISAVFFIAIALTTMIVMVRDLLAVMMTRSETDPLSGVLNRRGFEEHVAPILRVYVGSRAPLALVLCDLDHFKSVNDTYGHATGDLVIAAFARQLSLATIAGQVVGRVGGEEFAVVLPGANVPMARLFAEGVRSSFASLSIPGAPPGRTFTASFGIAELQDGEAINDLMARADAALYLAKTAGRDCVRTAPPTLEKPAAIGGRVYRTRRV